MKAGWVEGQRPAGLRPHRNYDRPGNRRLKPSGQWNNVHMFRLRLGGMLAARLSPLARRTPCRTLKPSFRNGRRRQPRDSKAKPYPYSRTWSLSKVAPSSPPLNTCCRADLEGRVGEAGVGAPRRAETL